MSALCDYLLTSRWIVTQDENRTVLSDGAVAVDQGKILALGPREDILSAYQPREAKGRVDLGESVILPGLVNSHCHASMTLLRGLADDLPLMTWLNEHIFPVEQHLSPELVELGATLACAEMTATGATAFHDMYLLENAVAKAVDAAGLRAVVGEVVFGFPSPAYPDPQAALDLVRETAQTWRGHSRVRVAVKPHAVYTTDEAILQSCFALAEELDLVYEIHLAETIVETQQCLDKFGKRPVAYLGSLGILGPRTMIAHAVDLNEEEINRIANSRTRVAHMPESNMKLASGISPVPELLAAGVVVGIGTDGAASNNNLNMFTEMGSCALLHKVRTLDPTVMNAQTVLDMATINGGVCLGWPELGQLIPGRPADLVALDATRPNLQPLYNPVSHIVYSATGQETRLTMVEGEILYQDGAFTRIDYDGLLREIAEARKWVLKTIG